MAGQSPFYRMLRSARPTALPTLRTSDQFARMSASGSDGSDIRVEAAGPSAPILPFLSGTGLAASGLLPDLRWETRIWRKDDPLFWKRRTVACPPAGSASSMKGSRLDTGILPWAPIATKTGQSLPRKMWPGTGGAAQDLHQTGSGGTTQRGRSLDFGQPAGLHVVNVAVDRDRGVDERVSPDAHNVLDHCCLLLADRVPLDIAAFG